MGVLKAAARKLVGNFFYHHLAGIYSNFRTLLALGWRKIWRRPDVVLDAAVSLEIFEEPLAEIFFGYYDLTPFSRDERRILAMRKPLGTASRTSEIDISVGYFDLEVREPRFVEVGKTTTWCWQQGCRLQWFPGESDRMVLYNRRVGDGHGAVVQNIETMEIERTCLRPIYSLSGDGRVGLSLNFARLQRLRPGYGYDDLPDETAGENQPEGDGIWSVDVESGESALLFSVAEVARMDPRPTMDGAEHYFNHIMWNSDSTRFMFFHLWMRGGKRHIRLVTAGPDGGEPFVLYNEDHISHYWWLGRDEIVAFSTHADTGSHYHLYKDKKGCVGIIGESALDRDGHPSFRPGSRMMLTDSYPDGRFERGLLLYDTDALKLKKLGDFYSPPFLSGERRCDLHPRWSPSGKMICVDSAHRGKRRMCVLNLH